MSYATDLEEMLNDVPAFYSIGSSQYVGAVNEVSKGQDAGEGGFLDDFDLTLIGKKTDHSTLPAIGSKITYDSQAYRIEKITTTGDGAEVRFDLMSADR
jgi:hypothetical protein